MTYSYSNDNWVFYTDDEKDDKKDRCCHEDKREKDHCECPIKHHEEKKCEDDRKKDSFKLCCKCYRKEEEKECHEDKKDRDYCKCPPKHKEDKDCYEDKKKKDEYFCKCYRKEEEYSYEDHFKWCKNTYENSKKYR